MPACEKCWGDAYMRWLAHPSKSQSEHYLDLLEERKDNPCSEREQREGRRRFREEEDDNE
jgi:hypothetical protein